MIEIDLGRRDVWGLGEEQSKERGKGGMEL